MFCGVERGMRCLDRSPALWSTSWSNREIIVTSNGHNPVCRARVKRETKLEKGVWGRGEEEEELLRSPAPLWDGGSAMSLSQTKDSTLLVLLIIINLIKWQLQLRTQR